ncbi:MAG: transposase [Planctomyces sp.]|nr:transposase [Planctomyces sp.]
MDDSNQSTFHPLDRSREVDVSYRNLPHWFQAGAAIFVTFRTVDSMPKEVVLRMQRELQDWLRFRNLPEQLAISSVEQKQPNHEELLQSLNSEDRGEFRRLLNRLFQGALDECHGRCLLQQPELAQIVATAIRHDDGVKFDLDRFLVMPNHVHAIVQFYSGFDLSVVGQSWMRYSARLINAQIGDSGAFWQAEPFDHIIRSAEQFLWLQRYIADNPLKAGLRPGEFLLWTRPGSN